MRAPRGFWTWLRWEFSRRIEMNGVIVYIICERFLKGTVLAIGGVALLVLSNDGFIAQITGTLQEQLNLNPGQGLVRRTLEKLILKFGNATHVTQDLVAVAALLYGLLEVVEGIGLILRRRWAEYLVLVATVVFIPYELDEAIKHFSLFKAVALLVNILIAVYLVWRKRLFLERPGGEVHADEPGLAAARSK